MPPKTSYWNKLKSIIREEINLGEQYQDVYQDIGKMQGNLERILDFLKFNGVTSAELKGREKSNHDLHPNLPHEVNIPTIEVKGNETKYAESLIDGLIDICNREKLMRPFFFK